MKEIRKWQKWKNMKLSFVPKHVEQLKCFWSWRVINGAHLIINGLQFDELKLVTWDGMIETLTTHYAKYSRRSPDVDVVSIRTLLLVGIHLLLVL